MDIDKLNYISSQASKLLKKNFGKGPKSCQTTLCKNHLVIYIRGFISPMEEVLLSKRQEKQVDLARTVIINHILFELKGMIMASLDVDIKESYHDWNFPNNSGIIMFVLDREIVTESFEESANIQALETEIKKISEIVQKVPDKTQIYPLSSSVYLAERVGILLLIEKALVEKGYEVELRFSKDELEKNYFHRDGNFSTIFNKDVKDIFVDWDFKNDKSMMAFILDHR